MGRSASYVFRDPGLLPLGGILSEEGRPELDAFVAAVLGRPKPGDAATFAAAILAGGKPGGGVALARAILYDSDFGESENAGGGRTADVSHQDFLDAILHGRPSRPGRSTAEILREYNFNPDEARDWRGRWSTGGSGDALASAGRGSVLDDLPSTYDCAVPKDGPEPPDDILARPPTKGGAAPTTADWFEKNIWKPLQRNGGTASQKEHLKEIFFTGCIGLATLTL